ncbi:MAG: HEPN domain-containing protein [Sedimentisphaerales bacterium]
MSPKEELVREWLTLADDDLRLADLTMKDTEPVYWAAAFHCQQAAEKSLKAFLAYNEYHVEKTHDIEFLIKLCMKILPEMEQFIEGGAALSEYAVAPRYPTAKFEITKIKAEKAMETAHSIFEFVLNALPDLSKLTQE